MSITFETSNGEVVYRIDDTCTDCDRVPYTDIRYHTLSKSFIQTFLPKVTQERITFSFPCTTEDVHSFIDLLRYYLMESKEQMKQRLGWDTVMPWEDILALDIKCKSIHFDVLEHFCIKEAKDIPDSKCAKLFDYFKIKKYFNTFGWFLGTCEENFHTFSDAKILEILDAAFKYAEIEHPVLKTAMLVIIKSVDGEAMVSSYDEIDDPVDECEYLLKQILEGKSKLKPNQIPFVTQLLYYRTKSILDYLYDESFKCPKFSNHTFAMMAQKVGAKAYIDLYLRLIKLDKLSGTPLSNLIEYSPVLCKRICRLYLLKSFGYKDGMTDKERIHASKHVIKGGHLTCLAMFLSDNTSLAQIMLDKFYPKPADRQQLVVLLDLSVKLQKSFTTLPYQQLYALHIKRLRQK
jgi:hypothetical protein